MTTHRFMKVPILRLLIQIVWTVALTVVLLPLIDDWIRNGSILLIGNFLYLNILTLTQHSRHEMNTPISSQRKTTLFSCIPFVWIAGISIGIEYALTLLFESNMELSRLIPTQILPWGLLFWLGKLETENENALIEEENELPAEKDDELPVETIDSVSVKVRKQLHIIPIDTITYLQGEGDYVAIVVDQDRYLKEETLKYYEAALPQNGFTRIHRSFLVNNRMITSIELHGKHQYLIKVRNGDTIKATLSGYRLLREKLNI